MNKIDEKGFVELALAEFPQLREELLEYDGLVHLQMAAVSHLANDAIMKADWSELQKCYSFIDRVLQRANENVLNAIEVSFVENLDLHSPVLGEHAKELLPLRLEIVLRELEEHFSRLAKIAN